MIRRSTILWFVIFVLVFVMSCGHSSIHYELHGGWSEQERIAFEEGCERWNQIAIVQQYVAPEDDGDYRVFLRFHEDIPFTEQPTTAIAFSLRRSDIMYVERGLPILMFKLAVLHEQGHALDLAWDAPGGERGHPPTGVMSLRGFDPSTNPIKPTPADLEECRRVGACN